ncbi:hypothetical protein ACLOJK_034502 [Asimina triloba]
MQYFFYSSDVHVESNQSSTWNNKFDSSNSAPPKKEQQPFKPSYKVQQQVAAMEQQSTHVKQNKQHQIREGQQDSLKAATFLFQMDAAATEKSKQGAASTASLHPSKGNEGSNMIFNGQYDGQEDMAFQIFFLSSKQGAECTVVPLSTS